MDADERMAKARAELDRDQPGRALRSAWEAAFAAEYVRDPDILDEIQSFAAQLEERTEGGELEESRRLAVYCAACSEDIRAGIPHDSTLSRLFRRR